MSIFLKAGRLYDDPMIFKCNRQSFPDLPEWLRFTQRHPYDNGFLYGTPTSPGKSTIEVPSHHLHQFPALFCCLVLYFLTFSLPVCDGSNIDEIPVQLQWNKCEEYVSVWHIGGKCQVSLSDSQRQKLWVSVLSCYFEPTLKIQEETRLWRRRDAKVWSGTVV